MRVGQRVCVARSNAASRLNRNRSTHGGATSVVVAVLLIALVALVVLLVHHETYRGRAAIDRIAGLLLRPLRRVAMFAALIYVGLQVRGAPRVALSPYRRRAR
jgi:hypothetical protein